MTKLAQWLKKKHIMQKGLAQDLGISNTCLVYILSAKRLPSLSIAYEIEKFTNGDVTLYDWLDQEEIKKNNEINSKKKREARRE